MPGAAAGHATAVATAPRPRYSYKPEKNWKLLYTRDAKLARARQLGFTYPVLSARQLQEQQ
ncbi:hypothetical protein ACE0DR_28705 [Azotobacter sp. CWF10]